MTYLTVGVVGTVVAVVMGTLGAVLVEAVEVETAGVVLPAALTWQTTSDCSLPVKMVSTIQEHDEGSMPGWGSS